MQLWIHVNQPTVINIPAKSHKIKKSELRAEVEGHISLPLNTTYPILIQVLFTNMVGAKTYIFALIHIHTILKIVLL